MGRPVPSSTTLPRMIMPRVKAMSTDCSTAPFGHSTGFNAVSDRAIRPEPGP